MPSATPHLRVRTTDRGIMPHYNKLVRDLMPEIIAADGKVPHIRMLDNSEFVEALRSKLIEEV